jgi:NitT/TauT family transport system permease protein
MKHSTVWIKKIGILVIWLGIWQIAYWYIDKEVLLPSPYATFLACFRLFSTKAFYLHVVYTIYRVLIGIVISLILGMITGILAYFIKGFDLVVTPFIVVLKATPVMAIIMIALLWFNAHQVPIFVAVLMCYPIVHTQILSGLLSVDCELLEVAKVFCIRKRDILKDIYIPHLMPYFQTTLSLIIGMSWKVTVAAEVLAVPRYAMGYNLLLAKSFLEVDLLFAWVLVIVILSYTCEKLMQKGVKK